MVWHSQKNRTIIDMVRCMLKKKNMPTEFWAKVVSCAIYLFNISLTKSLQNSTSNEAWYGRKPNVTHLKIFGCLAYSHIPGFLRTKLNDKSEKCVFIGYSERSKAYKLYNPKIKKIVISRMFVLMRNLLMIFQICQPFQVGKFLILEVMILNHYKLKK